MNPFILSTYVSPEYFCDREEETKQLIQAMENGRNTTLISTRRMGKSGLLKHLCYKYKYSNEFIYVYFDIMTTSNATEFIKLFADSLFRTHNTKVEVIYKSLSKVFASFKPTFSFNSITGESKFNIEISTPNERDSSLNAIFKYIESSKKKYIIAIDEFQQIVNYPENNFEAVLRSNIQHLKNATFLFSGSGKEILNNMFLNKKRPFYMSGEIMHLSKINKEKYREFIIDKFTKAKINISPEAVDYLLEMVNVHTYYVQLLCNKLYSEGLKTINESDINTIYSRILEENKYYFESYKNILTDYQWKLLQAIAKENIVSEITSKDFIYNYKLGSASSVATAAKSLLKKEILLKENSKYMLADLLFSSWLAK
jgi:uncharacterized protein